jgi:hypothetical protein
MIIWQGFGFLGVLIPVGCYILTALMVGSITGPNYLGLHSWPGALGTLVGAGLVWLLAQKLSGPGRILVDQQTGETVVLKKQHSLFFVPLRYVAVIMAVVALGILLFKHESTI